MPDPTVIKTSTILNAVRTEMAATFTTSLGLKVCEVGDVRHLIGDSSHAIVLPSLFVMPYLMEMSFESLGKTYAPEEELRLLYARSFDYNENPTLGVIAEVEQIANHLLAFLKGEFITLALGHNRSAGMRFKVDWTSPEETALVGIRAQAKVVAIHWSLKYDVF